MLLFCLHDAFQEQASLGYIHTLSLLPFNTPWEEADLCFRSPANISKRHERRSFWM